MPTLSFSPVDRIFVLTGAGVSAGRGIPTFRDAGGLWRTYRFEEVASPEAWSADPQLVWDFYSMRRRVASEAKPNAAHFALATLEKMLGDRFLLCTQNVDNLHEQAGSRRILHMHGELFKSRCEFCARPPFDDTNIYESPTELPRCSCGAKIRPHICWFGEIPFHLEEIFATLEDCTVFLAIGTSGSVQPAAGFAAHAKSHARSIYIGPEAPANRHLFDDCFLSKAGDLLPRLFAST